MKELKMIMNDDGVFEEYDDTYDLTIHCTSQEEQDEVLLRLNKTVETLEEIKLEIKQLANADTVDVLVDVHRIINKHLRELGGEQNEASPTGEEVEE